MKNNFDFNLSRKNCFFLIAGPCVIENEKLMEEVEKLVKISKERAKPTAMEVPFIRE